jgi:hypothetical protein
MKTRLYGKSLTARFTTFRSCCAELERVLEEAKGDVVVFMDTRQRVATESIKTLVENLADSTIVCPHGALMLGNPQDTSPRGVGLDWKMEKVIRSCESSGSSSVGAERSAGPTLAQNLTQETHPLIARQARR